MASRKASNLTSWGGQKSLGGDQPETLAHFTSKLLPPLEISFLIFIERGKFGFFVCSRKIACECRAKSLEYSDRLDIRHQSIWLVKLVHNFLLKLAWASTSTSCKTLILLPPSAVCLHYLHLAAARKHWQEFLRLIRRLILSSYKIAQASIIMIAIIFKNRPISLWFAFDRTRYIGNFRDGSISISIFVRYHVIPAP